MLVYFVTNKHFKRVCCRQAIHGYRETERLTWNEANTKILDRVRQIAFPPHVAQLKYVHILDLDKNGYIKPHIDAVRVSKKKIVE
jgi:alkylated DNA repair protein alkB family protein 7